MLSEYFKKKTSTKEFKDFLENLIHSLKDKKILVYGAGAGFFELIKKFDFASLNIVAISDIKFKKSQIFNGFNAIPPNKITQTDFDVILVTQEQPKKILEYLRKDLLLEYEDIRTIFNENIKDEAKNMYFLEKHNFKANLKKLEKEFAGKKIIIYGAGYIFQLVNKYYDLSKLNIIAVSDIKFNSHEPNEKFLGYNVCSPEEMPNLGADCILISAITFIPILKNLYYRFYNQKTKIKSLFYSGLKEKYRHFIAYKDMLLDIFLLNVFNKIQKFFPKDTILLFEHCNETDDLINVASVYEYMKKNNIKCKFVFNYNHKGVKSDKKLTIDCKNGKYLFKKIFFALLRSHTVISSVGFMSLDNFFAKNPYINYIYIDHGICLQKNFKYMGFTKERFNYFAIANNIEKEMVLKESNFEEKQLINCALPRFDMLKRNPHKNKNIFVMFTWRKSLNNENYWDSVYHKNITRFLSNPELKKLLKENSISLTMGLHPCMNKIKGLIDYLRSNYSDFNIIETNQISSYKCNMDLLITDYSSLFFDFAYMNIPAIFYRLDANISDEEYLEVESINYAKTKDKYLYNCCYDENEVLSIIKKYIDNSFELEQENVEKNSKFFDLIERGKCSETLIKKALELHYGNK